MSKLLLSVMGAFAEFERSLLKEHQREGIALAKKAGVYKGRKPSLTPERAAELRRGITGRGKESRVGQRVRHLPRNALSIRVRDDLAASTTTRRIF
jgi:DNA invertase Pin-like site-specific DNA recombinase